MDQPTTNYLHDLEQEVFLEPASKGARFVNFLIDYLVFYGVFFVIAMIYAAMILTQGGDIEQDPVFQENGSEVFQYLLAFGAFIAYYTLIEALSKGRSLGKLITGTVAVRSDGDKIGWKEAFLRTLCRLIPFEAIAALFTEPWHDSITNTKVVKKK